MINYLFLCLQRIRSNITGLKKSASESPKHHRHNPAIPSRMTDEAQMRSRVTSISGKAMRPKEMGITFGDSSSGLHYKVKFYFL